MREHMAYVQTEYGIGPAYYMCYQAWNLSESQLARFLTQRHSNALVRKYNDRASAATIARKDEFFKKYGEFTKRRFWLNRGTSFDEFLTFVEGLDSVFCKPLRARHGSGAFIVDLPRSRDELRSVYNDLMSRNRLIVEESIQQHALVRDFYPRSINTVRVIALQDSEGVHVISAPMRFGHQGITDNFSGGGMVCDVDLDTGRILTAAIDKTGTVYESHPYSGKPFIGFQVPHWDQVVDIAVNAMSMQSDVNYIGWDVAIQPEGACIVEGNSETGLALVQAPYAPSGSGRKHLVEPFLES
ncbi:MAG TPA: hypothetical protein H9830_03815 [Candidatus Agrococcus pullicola]|uniref:Alpha-L-glutamate ligase-related protein ATP-grasp domain-containing protein n=1 Tax=Candidatus Agrococcus pullicola TaxID=2838429 RepID=A0A9D2C7T6_9MICO|nr:hypothetical protein [Candidatus Agrococcus pullicola]